MRNAGADRARWMTFSTALTLKCNQTLRRQETLSTFQSLHRDHVSDHGRRDCGLQPRSINLGLHPHRRHRRRPEVELVRAAGKPSARRAFLDPVLDLTFYPAEQAAASQPASGGRRLGLWACRTCSSRSGCRRLRPPRGTVRRIAEESTSAPL